MSMVTMPWAVSFAGVAVIFLFFLLWQAERGMRKKAQADARYWREETGKSAGNFAILSHKAARLERTQTRVREALYAEDRKPDDTPVNFNSAAGRLAPDDAAWRLGVHARIAAQAEADKQTDAVKRGLIR